MPYRLELRSDKSEWCAARKVLGTSGVSRGSHSILGARISARYAAFLVTEHTTHQFEQARAPEIAVLLSGGIDSAALMAFYVSLRSPIEAIFVNYGQPAAALEERAAADVAAHFGVTLRCLGLVGAPGTGVGEIRSRNAFLATVASMAASDRVWGVALGLHAGSSYADCTPAFVGAVSHALSFQSRPLQILAPFVEWGRPDVLDLCAREGVPLELTYSCEAGTQPPCGVCLSCRDRKGM